MSGSTLYEFSALVPAGGTGSRLGGRRAKQFQTIAGRPMLAWTLSALLDRPWIRRIDVVVSATLDEADRREVEQAIIGAHDRLRWLPAAGLTRRDSVLGGLQSIASDSEWIMVHDAARPGLNAQVLERLRAVIEAGAPGALAALPVADTVKRAIHDGAHPTVGQTIPRTDLWFAQTPQVFQAGALRDALLRWPDVTDESSAMERAGLAPALVAGDWRNLKVTTAGDLDQMRLILDPGLSS